MRYFQSPTNFPILWDLDTDPPGLTSDYSEIDEATYNSLYTNTLQQAKDKATAAIESSYFNAIYSDIPFTTEAGVSQTFQADSASQNTLTNTLIPLVTVQKVPDGFYWKASDNTQVPFTYNDLNGLALAMFQRGVVAFQNRTAKKDAIASATTNDEATAIVF